MRETPGDCTLEEEKVEAKFIALGPQPKFLDPGTITKDLTPVESPWISCNTLLSVVYPKVRDPS